LIKYVLGIIEIFYSYIQKVLKSVYNFNVQQCAHLIEFAIRDKTVDTFTFMYTYYSNLANI